MTRPGHPVDKKVNWRKEIGLFFLISFSIWLTLFAFFYGLFLILEVHLISDFTAMQVLSIKWFFSLYFSILFSLEAWALGVYDLLAMFLERRNIIKHLSIIDEYDLIKRHRSTTAGSPSPVSFFTKLRRMLKKS
jgi:hypothetical protein